MMMQIWILLMLTAVVAKAEDAGKSSRDKLGCRKPIPKLVFRMKKNNVIDLTHPFDENAMTWPTNPFGFSLTNVSDGFYSEHKFFYAANTYEQPEHLGTHFDAPRHFSRTGPTAEQVPLADLMGLGVLVNLKENGERFGRDKLVTIEHFLKWEEQKKGRIRSGSIVLLYTGYGDVYFDRAEYLGTNKTGTEAIPFFRFPGLDPEAAEWLVKNRCIAAIGSDTPSIDHAQSVRFLAHRVFAPNNIPIFENVANLDKLATLKKGFKVIALPQKIRGGTGAPTRMIAVTD